MHYKYLLLSLLSIFSTLSLSLSSKTLIDKRLSIGTETGTISLFSTNIVSTTMTLVYKVNFRNSYNTLPKIAVTMNKLSLSTFKNQYDLGYVLVKQITGIIINKQLLNGVFTANSHFLYNYLASNNSNIQSHQFLLRGNSSIHHQLTFISNFNLNSSSISIGFYYQDFDDTINTSPSIFNISYYVDSVLSNKIYVKGYTTGQGTSVYNWYVFYGNIIIVRNFQTYRIVQGVYLHFYQSNSSFDILSYSPTVFFMGLRGFNVIRGNVTEIGFDLANQQIYSDSRFYNQIDFSYFFIDQLAYSDNIYLQSITYNPSQSSLYLQFKDLNSYQQITSKLSSLGTDYSYVQFSSGILKTQVIKQVPASTVDLILNVQNTTHSLIMKFSINIFIVPTVIIDLNSNTIEVVIRNCDSVSSIDDLIIRDARLVKKSFVKSNVCNLLIDYQNDAVSQQFTIEYEQPNLDWKYFIKLNLIPSLSVIETSGLSNSTTICISNIPNNDSITHTQLSWKSNNTNNSPFPSAISGEIKLIFQYSMDAQQNPILISYITNLVTKFQTIYSFRLITVLSIQVQVNSTNTKITWININDKNDANLSQFSISSTGPTFISKNINSQYFEIQVDSTSYNDGDLFKMNYYSPNQDCIAVVKSLKYYLSMYQNITIYLNNNTFIIMLKNVQNWTNSSNLNIYFHNNNKLKVDQAIIQSDFIYVVCNYSEQINQKISLAYNLDNNIIFKNLISLKMQQQLSLVYCQNQNLLELRAYIVWLVSIILSSLYLMTFILSIFSCKKMLGIQLMYLIQLTFYSLININIACNPFSGLEGLKYASGMSPIFNGLPQTYIIRNYSSLGIKSHFFANVNILLLPVFLLPIFYIPVNYFGTKSNNIHTKPRCKRYGKSLLFEAPLTILLFNSFNIYSSFIVNLQAFQSSYLIIAASAAVVLIIPIASLLFLKYKKEFKQFRDEFEDYFPAHIFNRWKATKIRRFYTFILIWQFVSVPLFLSIRQLFGISLYIVLALQILITVYTGVFPLYPYRIENIRNYSYRSIVLLIIVIQIITLNLKHNHMPVNSFVNYAPFVLLLLLILGFFTTGAFTIWKSVVFWKSRKLTDGKMKIRLIALRQRPIDEFQNKRADRYGQYAPRSQFKPFRVGLMWVTRPSGLQLPPDQNAPNNYDYITKFVNWFDDIGSKKLWLKLNLDKDDYDRFKLVKPNKFQIQIYITELFYFIKLFQLMIDFHDTIITIQDIMNLLEECKKQTIKTQYKKYIKF